MRQGTLAQTVSAKRGHSRGHRWLGRLGLSLAPCAGQRGRSHAASRSRSNALGDRASGAAAGRDAARADCSKRWPQRIHAGLSYQDVLAALLLAGVRNVQPRPSVGFKFHAVLVVNSAHLASLASPAGASLAADLLGARLLQETPRRDDIREGDWTMAAGRRIRRARVPARPAGVHRRRWTTGTKRPPTPPSRGWLARRGANEIFEIMFRYGARDFRSIGHKAIFVANS